MGGILGGKSTSQVQLPGFIEDAAQRAIQRGEQAAQIGFVPFSGPEVAAFTPMQEAAFAGTNQAASAFGLPTVSGPQFPEPGTFAGGVRGFSSRGLLDDAIFQLGQERPGQLEAIQSFFIDPVTGDLPLGTPVQSPVAPVPTTQGGGGGGTRVIPVQGDRQGFTSIRDMFDGGGAGQSGDRFAGGGILSDIFNAREDRLDRAGRKGLL